MIEDVERIRKLAHAEPHLKWSEIAHRLGLSEDRVIHTVSKYQIKKPPSLSRKGTTVNKDSGFDGDIMRRKSMAKSEAMFAAALGERAFAAYRVSADPTRLQRPEPAIASVTTLGAIAED